MFRLQLYISQYTVADGIFDLAPTEKFEELVQLPVGTIAVIT